MQTQEKVLSIVAEGPTHGYEIVRRLEEDCSSSAVYQAISRLTARRLIEPTTQEPDGRRKQNYQATPAGLQLNARRIVNSLDSRHKMLSALLRAPEGTIASVLDELEQRLLSDIGSEPARHPDVLSEAAWDERREVNGAHLRWIARWRSRLLQVADASLD